MLNLTKVFCLLLVATATKAQASLDSAQKSFEEAVTSSLSEMHESYNESAQCVEAAKSRVEWEIEKYFPGLQLPSSQPRFFGGIGKRPLDLNDPKSGMSEKVKQKVMEVLENSRISVGIKREELDAAFNKERGFANETQVAYQFYGSSGPDNIFTSDKAAIWTNVHREALRRQVARARKYFSGICEEAEEIVETMVIHLGFVIDN